VPRTRLGVSYPSSRRPNCSCEKLSAEYDMRHSKATHIAPTAGLRVQRGFARISGYQVSLAAIHSAVGPR
jgi:hypothetical protein